ncbi:MAG: helix-turn-helix domain-containing protein [Rhodobacteraceae bacterium]|nr:helix-turn-helix domain-containing protein [Paracoccaceae bacterium]
MTQIARTQSQLGNIIRRARKTAKMTQADLGKRAGLRQATVSQIESGDTDPSTKTVLDMLAALDLELVVRPRSKGSHDDIEDIF